MVKKSGRELLCVDVGNTSISIGEFKAGRIKRAWRYSRVKFPEFVPLFKKFVRLSPKCNVVISSVVPDITPKIRKIVGKNGWIIGENLKIGLPHKYIPLKRLGNDRLANAYGGLRTYGAPLLILDFGTALTCDYISGKGVFEGGLIIPGPEIAWEALTEKAAQLPKLSFPRHVKKSFLVGRDTRSGMEQGILQAYGSLTDGLIERFRKQYGRNLRTVATGGLARVIYPFTRKVDLLDPFLTLKSLALAFLESASPHKKTH